MIKNHRKNLPKLFYGFNENFFIFFIFESWELFVEKTVQKDFIKELEKKFYNSPHCKVVQNALVRCELKDLAMNTKNLFDIAHVFSNVVEGELSSTYQHKSGRCWIFAGLNKLRIKFAKHYKLESFEFSQSYLFFYDKLEKANYFLESILETANESIDSRLVMFLLKEPMQDGGQWDMFVSLINKYGLVPKALFPDTKACENSHEMNYILTLKLREGAKHLREMAHQGRHPSEIVRLKLDLLAEIYQILCLHLGVPPQNFDWEFTSKDKKYHRYEELTPLSFFEKFVKGSLNEYVCLVHSPREKTPYHKCYTVAYLGNVMEGNKVRYVNVPIEEMKKAAIKSLQDNEPVWFGCDVKKSFHREKGVMDFHLYDYDGLYATSFRMTKEDRMNYGESKMTHAMLFTGVNIVNDKPTRWRVENSWGDLIGDKGYFVMTDDWFDAYMFEVVVHARYLPKELITISKEDPIVLDPWDPLGALA